MAQSSPAVVPCCQGEQCAAPLRGAPPPCVVGGKNRLLAKQHCTPRQTLFDAECLTAFSSSTVMMVLRDTGRSNALSSRLHLRISTCSIAGTLAEASSLHRTCLSRGPSPASFSHVKPAFASADITRESYSSLRFREGRLTTLPPAATTTASSSSSRGSTSSSSPSMWCSSMSLGFFWTPAQEAALDGRAACKVLKGRRGSGRSDSGRLSSGRHMFFAECKVGTRAAVSAAAGTQRGTAQAETAKAEAARAEAAKAEAARVLNAGSRKDFRPVSPHLAEEAMEYLGLLPLPSHGLGPSHELGVSGGEEGDTASLEEEGLQSEGLLDAKEIDALGGEEWTETKARKVQELVGHLMQFWISKPALKGVLKRHPELLSCEVSEVEKRTSFFLQGGLSAGLVGTGFVRDPSVLLLPMEKLERIAAYLERAGVPAGRVARVILKNPEVVLLEEDEKMDYVIDFLQGLVSDAGGVESMIERQPMLLELSVDQVTSCVSVMRAYGMKADGISNLLVVKPAVLRLEPSVLSRRFEVLLGIINSRRLPNIFKVAPMLIIMEPEKIIRQYETLRAYFGGDVAERLVNYFPQALSLNWERKLLPKLKYLEDLGLQPSEVLNFPAYLGYSLADRIRPRCQLLLEAGFTIAPHAEAVAPAEKARRSGRAHWERLLLKGECKIAIQHIVGLRDEEFEAQFNVRLARVPRRGYEGEDDEVEGLDLDDLDELSDEAAGELL